MNGNSIRPRADVGLMVAPFSGNAQPADKVLRIGVLLSFLAPGDEPPQAFRQRLSGLGYIEGKNITIEWRQADRGYDRLPELAAELVQLKSDVILTDFIFELTTEEFASLKS